MKHDRKSREGLVIGAASGAAYSPLDSGYALVTVASSNLA